MNSTDRYFEAYLHLAVIDEEYSRYGRTVNLVLASYIGIPEAVRAISAGLAESRPIRIQGENYSRSFTESYKIHERPVGLGDVAHGVFYNTFATIEGIEGIVKLKNSNDDDENQKAYLIVPDGNVNKALADHLIVRFGLPREWENEYGRLFAHLVKPLQVIRNPQFSDFWGNLIAYRMDANEKTILNIVENALKNKALKIPSTNVFGTFNKDMTMKEYMIANAEHFAKKLQEKQPRHTPDMKLHPSIAQMKRIPFPTQAHMIQGVVNTLDYESSVFCSGDMGTGKSLMAIGVANTMHQKRIEHGAKKGFSVLLSAPGITIPKWANKEILKTLPYAKVTILQNSDDALKLLRKVRQGYKPKLNQIEFVLVGLDRSKLGHEPFFSGIWKRIKGTKDYAWHCPDCGETLMKWDKDEEELVPLEWEDVAEGYAPSIEHIIQARQNKTLRPNGLPNDFVVKWKRSKKYTQCTAKSKDDQKACQSKLWRPALKSRGETKNRPRYNISRILKKTKRYFDLFIQDEVHQTKAEDSGRGDAFASMIKAARKNLLLTGTLVNGKSTSIKEILWRTTPKELIDQGFDNRTSSIQWAKRYGKLKTVVEVDEKDNGWVTRQKRKPKQPTEEPGIAPQLTANYLLHKAGFLELPDMGLPLVELKELPIFINMDREHALEYSSFHESLHQEAINRSLEGFKGAWAKFIPATINYADRPDLGGSVTYGTGEDALTITARKFDEDYYHAKERKLIEIVEEEVLHGRGCVIYNNYTGAYGLNERTKKVLEENIEGVKIRIINESNTEKRQEILDRYEEEGVQVIITNLKLVEVGLDLMTWPSIIYYQMNYEVNTVRQASRRAWRIGQETECRVYYLVYNGTQQMSQFMKVMAARGHAMMVEGRLDKSELAQYSRDTQSSLASDLASCFAGTEVAEAWTRLAAKDLEDVEMVEESKFKDVLQSRMKALANETRRLCGLPPIEDKEEKLDQEPIAVDLFNYSEQTNTEPVAQMELFDENLKPKIVVVGKNTYFRGSKKVSEGQLAFAL
ncbi:MAG: helicase-related protein [Tepidibacillus sp.]